MVSCFVGSAGCHVTPALPGPVALEVCRAFNEGESCGGNGTVMNPGDEEAFPATDLGPTANSYLNFSNASPGTDGQAEVEIVNGDE